MVHEESFKWILVSLVLLFQVCKAEFLQPVPQCPKSFYQFESKSENFVTCCPCQSCLNALPTVYLPKNLKCIKDDSSKACSQYDTSKCCKLSDCYALLGQTMDTTELCKLNCDKNAVCDVNNRLVSCRCKIGYKGSGRKCKKVKSQSNRKSNMQSASESEYEISPESITGESSVMPDKNVPALFIIIGVSVVFLFAIFCLLVCIRGKKVHLKFRKKRLSSRSSEEIITTTGGQSEIQLECSPTPDQQQHHQQIEPDCGEDARSLLSVSSSSPRDVLEDVRMQPPQHPPTTTNNAGRDIYSIVTGPNSVIKIGCQEPSWQPPNGQRNQVPENIPRNNRSPCQQNYRDHDLPPPPKYDMDSLNTNDTLQDDSTLSYKTPQRTPPYAGDSIRNGQTHPISNRNDRTDEIFINQSTYSNNRPQHSTSDEECLSSSFDIYCPQN